MSEAPPFDTSLQACIDRARFLSKDTGTPHVVVAVPHSSCFGVILKLAYESCFASLGYELRHTFVNGEEVTVKSTT